MKTVHFAFTLLALSMVAAFPLIGESFAQTAPTAVKAEFTGPNQITIEFSEQINNVPKAGFGDVTISGTLADGTTVADGTTRNVINTAHVEERKIYRLIIDGKPLGTDARATIVLNPNGSDGSTPVDEIKNRADPPVPLEQVSNFPIFDGQAPQIKSVRIIDNDDDNNPVTNPPTEALKPQVEIVYTESVVATTANYNYRELNVNGIAGVDVDTEGAPIAVDADAGILTAPTHILELSGSPLAPETTGSINFVMTSNSDGDPTGLIDTANTGNNITTPNDPAVSATPNVLVATDGHPLTNHFVEAGQIPTVVSATFIDNPDGVPEDNINRIAIKFSEDILATNVSNDNFTNLVLDDGTSRNPNVGVAQGTGDDGSSTIILTYLGDEITTGATGTINIAPIIDNTGDTPVVSSLKDAAGNAVKAETAYVVKDGQKPKIKSAKITGPNEINFEFSERVVGVKRSNFGDFYVGNVTTGADADKRNLTILNTGGEIIKFRVSGNEIDTSAQGIIVRSLDLTSDNDDNPDTAIANITDDATPSNTIVAHIGDYTVNPGQTPKIMSAKIVSPTQVHIVFTETIQVGSNTSPSFDVSNAVTFYKNNGRDSLSPVTPNGAEIRASTDLTTLGGIVGDTIVLTFPNDPFVPADTGSVSITDDIISATNNDSDATLLKFKGVERYPVEAGQIPTIKSIAITAPDKITVTFSESVQAKGENFTKFTLTGGTDITPGETLVVTAAENVSNHTALGSDNNMIVLDITDGDLPTDAVGTINVAPTVDGDGEMDSLRDSDGIFVKADNNYVVTDGQSPNLTSATLTAPNQITIKFSEKVNAVWSDFTNLQVEGIIRNITGFSGSGSDTMTLTVGGAAIASSLADDDVKIDIAPSETDEDNKQTSLVDLVGNPLMLTDAQTGTDVNAGAVLKSDDVPRVDPNDDFLDWPIAQGQIPKIISASITDSNEITIKFSIPVNAVRSDFTFTLNGENTPRNITSISGSGTDTIILTISGKEIAPEAEGTIDIAGTVIGSVSGVALDAQNDYKVAAGQVPTVSVASITGPNTVTVTFDVSVNVSEENFTFTVDGESKPRAVDSAIQTTTDGVVEITLINTDTDDVNDMPANATGKININGVKNTNTNIVMERITNYPVLDGQAPAVSSAKITDRNDDGDNTVTIKFTERVHTTFSDYSNFVLTAGTGITANESREIIGFDHPTTGDTVVLYITGNVIPVDATGMIDIAGNVTDLSGNTMNAVSALQVDAGQIPTIVSAMFTGPNTISIKFSEPVMANVNHFKDFKVTDAVLTDAARNISTIGGNETDTIHVTVQGTFNIDATATIDIEKEITDLANPPNELAQREDDYDVVFDPRPSIMSAEITGSNQITIKFSEPVTTNSGDYVDLKITYDNPADDTDKITTSFNIDPTTNIGSGTDTVTLVVRDMIPLGATGSVDLNASKYTDDPNGVRTYTSMVDNRGQILKELLPNLVTTEEPLSLDDQKDQYVVRDDYPLSDGRASQTVSDRGIVKGVIFSDDNGNDIRDAGERGIRAPLVITPNLPGSPSSGLNGSYSISNIPVGPYTISVASPTGYASVSSQTVTVEGDKTKTVNFALKPLVTVSGTVFDDANDNDVKDTDEVGIPNVTVSILGTAFTGMTNDMGVYTISNVPAGSYTISVSGSGYDGITQTVNVVGGSTDSVDFALGSVGTIIGTVSDNMNMGIENVSVSITGITDPVLTGSNGTYRFVNVPTGSQTVTITLPENYIGDNSMSVTVGSGSNDPVNFTLTPVGTVMGTVSNSLSEDGIPNIMVSITGTDFTAMTGTDGMYEIMNVPTGTYDVMLDVSDGYLGSTSMETTVSKGMSASVDFTLTPVGMISGMVFSDSDGDGSKGDSETGLAGVTVSITGTELTAVTGNDGMYTIPNVPVGDQVVTVTAPDTHFVEMATMSVTVTQGGTVEANFALEPMRESNTATISGTVFDDLNGNGIQDDGEGGFGVYSMMAVTNMTTGDVQNTNTDENGMYSFTVRAGDPHLIQTTFFPTGITVSDPNSSWFMRNVTVEAGMDYDFDVGFHTVVEGEFTTLDLTIFLDANRNGMMDEDESGISGIRLNTYTYTIGAEDIITNAEGKVLKTDLVPADWAVQWGHYGIPAGYGVTGLNYERSDSTVGKLYDSSNLVVDDPEKNSTHTMTIGLVPTS